MLRCISLTKSFGPRPLFRDISISFDDGERTGLIGPNGSGKSTFLKILTGQETSDSGSVEIRRGLRLGYLPQEDRFPAGLTVHEAVVAAQADLPGAAHSDEHEQQTKADILLGKMGFTDFAQPADTLSGGWRKRLAIARELIREPDLLLLDEPTNHLDLEGILWLEELLLGARFAFLLVSHDRYFLENVTNRTVELNTRYPDGYFSVNGDYGEFLERREAFLEAQSVHQQTLAGQVKREIEWLRRGAKARRTKAKGRIEQAGRMIDELADLRTRNVAQGAAQLDFTASGRQTRKLLTAKSLSKSISDRPLFSDLNLVLKPGVKLGLLGPNGSGKTSLIRVLAGEDEPDKGELWRADGLRIVRFEQNRATLDQSDTLRHALSPTGETIRYRGESMHVTGWAAQFLFRREQLDMRIGELSGGEQARVLIARLVLQPADLLILDEPTNDLDIPSLEVLETSLADFPGALLLVTHDRMMLDRLSTELLALDGKGGVKNYASLAQWQAAQESAAEAAQAAKVAARPVPKTAAAGPKRLTYMELRELEGMEAKILAAEADLHHWQKQLEDPKVLADRNKLHEACAKGDAAQKAVTELYARWEGLESRR